MMLPDDVRVKPLVPVVLFDEDEPVKVTCPALLINESPSALAVKSAEAPMPSDCDEVPIPVLPADREMVEPAATVIAVPANDCVMPPLEPDVIDIALPDPEALNGSLKVIEPELVNNNLPTD